MLRKLFCFGSLLFAFGCHHSQTANDSTTTDSISETRADHSNDTSLINHSETNPINKEITNYISDRILFPNASYRISVNNEIGKILEDGEWLELYKDQTGYIISKPDYIIQNEEEEPCSGLPTQTIQTKRNSLLLFKIPNIKEGKVDSISINNKILPPNHTFEFTFEQQKYILRAIGIDPLKQNYRDNPNAYYALTLTKNTSNTDILFQKNYNDTVTEILFIGDIDKDGKPDFILSSPRDYEEDRIIIVLSKDNKHYEGTRQFDC